MGVTPFLSANHLAAKIKSKPQKQKSLKAAVLQPQISVETQNLQVQATILAFQIRKSIFLPSGGICFPSNTQTGEKKSQRFGHWSMWGICNVHCSYEKESQICSRARHPWPGRLSIRCPEPEHGTQPCALGARNPRLIIPPLKGNGQSHK